MKISRINFLLLINALLFVSIQAMADGNGKTDKSNWKSAEEFLAKEDFDKARDIYLDMFAADKQNFNLAFKIGYCYVGGEASQDVVAAIDYLKLACENVNKNYKNKLKEKKAPVSSWYYLGVAYRLNKEYDKAIDAFKTYEGMLSKKDRKSITGGFISREIQSCKDAKEVFNAERMNINAIVVKDLKDPSVRCPILSFDANRLVFTNGKFNIFPPDVNWDKDYNDNPFDGVYTAIKDPDGNFHSPEAISKDLQISYPYIPVTATSDGSELYLVVDKYDNGDIYVSKYVDGKYQPATKVKALNTKKWESHASISADGKRIYFTSLRKGGEGGLDIWYSDRDEEGEWLKPVNIGTPINTPFHEEMPYVIRNGNALYFSSEGHVNLGGFDVFYSNYDDATKSWAKPENLGYPFSTAGNDMGYIIENSPIFAFCPVNNNKRRAGVGECDCISLIDEQAPMLASISGIVELDPENDELLLQTRVKLIDKATGEEIENIALDKDGNYKFEGVKTGSYDIVAYANNKDLMTISVNVPQNESWDITGANMRIPTVDVIASTDTVPQQTDIVVIEDEYVRIENVFFDFDKYDIKTEYNKNLETLAAWLVKNPNAKISIAGHTDHYGDDQYNIELSKNRVLVVRNFLTSKGVKMSQIVVDFYGEKDNITIPVTEDQIRKLNRRVVVKVIDQGIPPMQVKPIEVPEAYRKK
jgi:outer membrane protein OmpA-like peptidoglycan-associated protein